MSSDLTSVPKPLKEDTLGWPWELPDNSPLALERYPKISIALPTYGHGDYIEETIRSILLQGYPNLEFIVMDGGSEDRTVDILKHYDDNIAYWESAKDKGQSDAINKALKRCTGDIITFQNSDDIYLPGTFHEVAKLYLQKPDAGVIAGGFYFFDADSNRLDSDVPAKLDAVSPVDLSLGPEGIYRIHQAATFFTRAALDDVGRYVREDLNYTMDRELLYRVLRKYPAVLSDRTFAAFRKHPGSKSTNSVRPFAAEFSKLHLEFLNGNPAEDAQRRRMAKYRLYRGEIQFAKLSDSFGAKLGGLFGAVHFQPGAIFRKSYLWLWYKLLTGRL